MGKRLSTTVLLMTLTGLIWTGTLSGLITEKHLANLHLPAISFGRDEPALHSYLVLLVRPSITLFLLPCLIISSSLGSFHVLDLSGLLWPR